MLPEIAIVGMACRYPNAQSPMELWENVLAQRQAFRQFPPERFRLQDYFSIDRTVPDTTYSTQGAFLENYEFDRIRFHISGATYRASDLVHWLALDVASQALQDAGFHNAGDLPSDATGVIVGNTLTGEFSRANSLRLRWPYVRRIVEDKLLLEGWLPGQCRLFLKKLEEAYKEPFAPIGEETLAGGLSNTIAGRICNYFNLKGGGYTVDGACASSLLATITACSALVNGDIDLALAGGVDLSIDPFEIIGFAKTAALASGDMRVYDVHSDGFLPGEGCGFVTLMRYDDAIARQCHIYAIIRGWGISSDGSGGITRPEVEGQALALTRAYKRAGIGIDSITYFEGHGTGTRVGDTTELHTLSLARRQANASAPSAAIGSVKANIGHTKAAAGIAGLIKATMALHTQLLPPTTGAADPHQELQSEQSPLHILRTGTIWPSDAPLRAAVNAMGFGGINTHVVLEGDRKHRRSALTAKEKLLLSSPQDAELILLREQSIEDALKLIDRLLLFSSRLSNSDITDLAVHLAENLHDGDVRAALIVNNAHELTTHLERLKALLLRGDTTYIDEQAEIFLGCGTRVPRIGFLFTGQGAPLYRTGGLLRRRFISIEQLYTGISFPDQKVEQDTALAQPAIVTASLAALSVLRDLHIIAEVAIGHSLGELTALHWAGAFDEQTLLRLASQRGQIMSELGNPTGRMASIIATSEEVKTLIGQEPVVISALNAPRQTVISGEATAVATVVERAKASGLSAIPLPVTQAFHSPLVAQAAQSFVEQLADEQFLPLKCAVYSTVTGDLLDVHVDLKELLCQQITAPVQFMSTLNKAATDIDFWFESGPGNIIQSMASRCISQPIIALDAGSQSLKGILAAAGVAFAQGVPLNVDFLFKGRFHRPFDLNWHPHFLANPCEQAPLQEREQDSGNFSRKEAPAQPELLPEDQATRNTEQNSISALHLVMQTVASRTELPQEAISTESRMLSDLHLNSITVGQIVSEVARTLKLLPPIEPTQYADATVAEIACSLEELQLNGGNGRLEEQMMFPAGVDSWVEPFRVAYIEKPLRSIPGTTEEGRWRLLTPLECSLTVQLRAILPQIGGSGVVVCLPSEVAEQHLSLLLEGAQSVLKQKEQTHFVLIQYEGEGSGLARTFFLENQQKTVCVVDLPLIEHPDVVRWITAEICAAHGYSEARYDQDGMRYVPQLQHIPLSATTASPLTIRKDDVLLVTGGGKGIAAESAIFLARKLGVRLAILGRSKPEGDQKLQENLRRMNAANIDYRYYSVDVTQTEAVQQSMRAIEADLGTVTAILHGTGVNVPKLISNLENADIMQTFAPKVHGLQNILAALDTEKLRLLVTFGSVIARTGMQGEADYALANDWLARLTEVFQHTHPTCRCLCLEWSIWSGIGMGERLGRVEALMRDGILPIRPEEGINQLYHLLNHALPQARIVVSSRLGNSTVLAREQPQLPFLRFLEQPKIFYPGLELVVEVELSSSTDPYVDDHKFMGERILPAVTGLEAIVQVAMGVSQNDCIPSIDDIHFDRPVVIPEHGTIKLRLAALVRETGKVDVVVRSEETAFLVDHFRATCNFAAGPQRALKGLEQLCELARVLPEPIDLEPGQDLYGPILFHQGRFQRIRSYRHLRSKTCIAEITPSLDAHPYIHYLPDKLLLGDFTARDAVIHAIQACIPHGTLLPIGVEHIVFIPQIAEAAYPRFVYAQERERVGTIFTYDVEVRTEQHEIVEQWEGLRLQLVAAIKPQQRWKYTLLVPFLERKVNELCRTDSIGVAFQNSKYRERHKQSEQTLRSIIGSTVPIYHLSDGRPVALEDETYISISHTHDLTLGVAASQAVGCDIETVLSPSSWQDLLGQHRYQLARLIAGECHEEIDVTATRTWTALESLKKAGAPITVPLTFRTSNGEGWVCFSAGQFRVMTYVTRIQKIEGQLSLAICIKLTEQ